MMTDKITDEMRAKLREPLPPEAVSQHPTKTYLSSIKSIYVVERINDVFGLGSWTLKGEVMERLEKFVVVKAILEIPGVGFYGEAYGGNDNADIGDAYKGATTDGLTKIAAQQLEIGIDVFKGVKPNPSPQATESKSSPVKVESNSEHWCKEHNTEFFMRGKMKSYGHPIEGSDDADGKKVWCHEHKAEPDTLQAERDSENFFPSDPKHAAEAAREAAVNSEENIAERIQEVQSKSPIDLDWIKEQLTILQGKGIKAYSDESMLSYMRVSYKGVKGETIYEIASNLDKGQAKHLDGVIRDALKKA